MLFVYNKSDRTLSVCRETEFKEYGIFERQDIERWIENNPQILGEDLLIVAKEYDGFDKTDERLDLLAIDKWGKLVVIELKRDDSGRSVDMQAVKYAAYCSTLTSDDLDAIYASYLGRRGEIVDSESAHDRINEFLHEPIDMLDESPRIMLVARHFRPEVTATVLWLRKKEIDIRCVKLTPHVLDQGRLAIDSALLIPVPEAQDFTIRVEHKEIVEATVSRTQTMYTSFYRELKKEFETMLGIKLAEPQGRHYYQIPSSVSGVHFEWAFHGRPRSSFGVELHFERGGKDANRKALAHFEPLKAIIQNSTGEDVKYQASWGKNWSRVYIERPGGDITDDLKSWALDRMERMYKTLYSEIEKIDR